LVTTRRSWSGLRIQYQLPSLSTSMLLGAHAAPSLLGARPRENQCQPASALGRNVGVKPMANKSTAARPRTADAENELCRIRFLGPGPANLGNLHASGAIQLSDDCSSNSVLS